MTNAITISNACVYRNGKKILNGINLSVPEKRHTFILGPNGAGKTTLVKLLLGYSYPAFGGKINVLGRKFGADNIRELRRHIGVASPLLKEFDFSEMTVMETVISGLDAAMGLFREPQKNEIILAQRQLEKLSILHLADRTCGTLSSGEEIRVLIARALILEPQLLILDEPCVFLDPAGREILLDELEKLANSNSDTTILYITQRVEDIPAFFQYGLLLSDGKIFAEGKRNTLLNEDTLSAVFKTPLTLIEGKNGRLWSVCK